MLAHEDRPLRPADAVEPDLAIYPLAGHPAAVGAEGHRDEGPGAGRLDHATGGAGLGVVDRDPPVRPADRHRPAASVEGEPAGLGVGGRLLFDRRRSGGVKPRDAAAPGAEGHAAAGPESHGGQWGLLAILERVVDARVVDDAEGRAGDVPEPQVAVVVGTARIRPSGLKSSERTPPPWPRNRATSRTSISPRQRTASVRRATTSRLETSIEAARSRSRMASSRQPERRPRRRAATSLTRARIRLGLGDGEGLVGLRGRQLLGLEAPADPPVRIGPQAQQAEHAGEQGRGHPGRARAGAAPTSTPLPGRHRPGQDRLAGQEPPQVLGQRLGRGVAPRRGPSRRHFRQIVSRSRGSPGSSRDGGTGSADRTCWSVSRTVAPRNGGRPVSSS